MRFRRRDPRPVMVNFSRRGSRARGSPSPAAGQSPVSGSCKAASTSGRAAVPAATASRGRVIPSISALRGRSARACRAASVGRQIDDQADHGDRLVRRAAGCRGRGFRSGRPAPAPGAPAAGRARLSTWARSSATSRAKGSAPCAAALQQSPGQPRFAGAGRPADQHGLGADQHGGGVDGRDRGSRAITSPAGAPRSARRARAARSSPAGDAPCGSRPGCVPPCASTICLEIDRPSPEFWPKPWCGRSV